MMDSHSKPKVSKEFKQAERHVWRFSAGTTSLAKPTRIFCSWTSKWNGDPQTLELYRDIIIMTLPVKYSVSIKQPTLTQLLVTNGELSKESVKAVLLSPRTLHLPLEYSTPIHSCKERKIFASNSRSSLHSESIFNPNTLDNILETTRTLELAQYSEQSRKLLTGNVLNSTALVVLCWSKKTGVASGSHFDTVAEKNVLNFHQLHIHLNLY